MNPVDTKNVQHLKNNEEKNAKSALTSQYANGHRDPCDKCVKHFDIFP